MQVIPPKGWRPRKTPFPDLRKVRAMEPLMEACHLCDNSLQQGQCRLGRLAQQMRTFPEELGVPSSYPVKLLNHVHGMGKQLAVLPSRICLKRQHA